MKNLSNILRRSDITPFERVMAIVHNDVHREKTGKDILSESDLYSLTKGWRADVGEANKYNKYINIVQLESTMKIDAQMFFYRSEASTLKNQMVLDDFLHRAKIIMDTPDQSLVKAMPTEECIQFLTQHTYLPYKKVLHLFTFYNLPKKAQGDLIFLDPEIKYGYIGSSRFHELLKSSEKTDKYHKLFNMWRNQFRKSEKYLQDLVDSNKLEKITIEKEFLGTSKITEAITGNSLFACTENTDFVKEYKKQIKSLLPIAKVFLFIQKYAMPAKNYKTLCEFKNLAQKVSDTFDIDMTEKYTEFIKSYQEETTLLNLSSGRLVDTATDYLYLKEAFQYTIDIDESGFAFDLKEECDAADILQMYSDEFKKLRI